MENGEWNMNVRVNLYALLFHITQFEIKMENGKLYRNSPFSIFNSQFALLSEVFIPVFLNRCQKLLAVSSCLCVAYAADGQQIELA